MPLDSSVDKIRVRGRSQLSTGVAGPPPSFFPTVDRLVNKASHSRIEMLKPGPYDNPTTSPDPTAPIMWNPTTGDWWADLIAVDDTDVLAAGQTQWGQWGVDDRGQRYYIEPKLVSPTFYGAPLTGAPLAQGSGGIRTVWLDDLAQLFSPTTIVGFGGLSPEDAQDTVAGMFTSGTHSGIGFAYDDDGNRINATVTVTGDLPESSAGLYMAPAGTPTDLLGKINEYTGAVTQPMPAATTGRVLAVRQRTAGLTLQRAGSDVFVIGDGTSQSTFSPSLPGELVALHCTVPGQWRVTGSHKPQTGLDQLYQRIVSLAAAKGDGTTDDTAVINGLLAAAPAGSVVRGVPGKNYLISAPLVLRAGGRQVLDMTGCTVTLKAGSNCNLLNNAAVTPVRTVTDGAMTAASATLTSASAAFTSADVGRSVNVPGAGPSGSLITTTIVSVTDGSNVVLKRAATTTVSAASVPIFNRDVDIRLVGGTWDRGANGGGGVAQHSIRLRHFDGARITGLTCKQTNGKFFINPADGTDLIVEDIVGNVSSNLVQPNGPLAGAIIRNISGYAGDDTVAFVPLDWASIADSGGDITDVLVENITAYSVVSQIKMLASLSGDNKRIVLRNVGGSVGPSSSGAIWIGNDAGDANTTGGTCDDITLDQITVATPNGTPQVLLNGSAMGRVRAERLRFNNSNATAPVISVAPPAGSTISSLIVDDVSVLNQGNSPVVNTTANVTIASLVVTNVVVAALAATGNLVVNANGPISTVRVTGVSVPALTVAAVAVRLVGNSTDVKISDVYGASTAVLTLLQVHGTVGDASIDNASVFGAGASFAVHLAAATSAITRLTLSNIHWGVGQLVNAATATHVLPTVSASNIVMQGSAWIGDVAMATEWFLANVSALALSNGMFNVRATAALIIHGHGLTVSGAVVVSAGGTIRSRSADVPLNVSGLGAALLKNDGDLVYNNNGTTALPGGPMRADGTRFVPLGKAYASGTATLAAGTVAVANTAITAGSLIRLTTINPGGTVGTAYVSARTAGTGFTITSTSNADTSAVFWEVAQF